MKKAELREHFLNNRLHLTSLQVEEASELIAENFKRIPLSGISFLHTFYPIVGRAEVNSLLISDRIKKEYPEIKLVLSKINSENNTLDNYIWEENTPLAMNKWGITEPENGQTVDASLLDIILIPLLAFDKKGNRIGYGKGFYDRFLTECRPDAKKIGLSIFDPVEEIRDTDPFDFPLDCCITPSHIWHFSS
ncbi:5-formyltetrahydrofolate cyclo-ligase [Rubrolithibacter danxiaensis]|uniref:5-formyltetrahydrofolate cyclo-ligase n=1 Tax=Rubrolithibacter danxiaensis TaxID=3390805 RepID=UPI003BF8D143